MVENIRKCPICDSDYKRKIKLIKNIVPNDFILPFEYNLVACDNCGFVFNDVPNDNRYNEYYSNYKENTNFSIPSESSYLTTKEKRESRFHKTVNFIKNNTAIDKSTMILDVGCSFGGTLTILKQEGFSNLFALDVDKQAIEGLRQIGITTKEGSIFSEDISEFNNNFDLIILGHILEHLHEPKKAILNISKWLKNDGKVYIECPDLYQYQETAPFPGFFAEWEHINHFSIISLMNLMNNFKLKSYNTGTIYALIENFPCLYSIFEKGNEVRDLCKTKNDEISMLNSLTFPNEQGSYVLKNIEKLKDKNIAIWGAGQYCYMLLSNTFLPNYNIQYIVDKDEKKHSKKILDIEIKSPQVLENFDGTIVICSTTAKDYILEDIQSMGLTNPIVIPFL